MNEGFSDFTVTRSRIPGWRTATFNSNASIPTGSHIWFGVFTDFFWEPRFDFGAKCYACNWLNTDNSIPNTYPLYNVNWFENFKLSMYFTYSTAQNYVRVLTQGVRLADNRNLKTDYKRIATDTARVNSGLFRIEIFCRNCIETVKNTMKLNRLCNYTKTISDHIKTTINILKNKTIEINCADTVGSISTIKKNLNMYRSIQDNIIGNDNVPFAVLYMRSVIDYAIISHTSNYGRVYFREIEETAGNMTNTEISAEYFRHNTDTVQVVGNVFRGLMLFVRIVTQVFIKDFILQRFLVAREELVLKSCITRELEMDSKIN